MRFVIYVVARKVTCHSYVIPKSIVRHRVSHSPFLFFFKHAKEARSLEV